MQTRLVFARTIANVCVVCVLACVHAVCIDTHACDLKCPRVSQDKLYIQRTLRLGNLTNTD